MLYVIQQVETFNTENQLLAKLKVAGEFLNAIRKAFVRDDCPRMAAGLSYYTAFAIPPLIILLMMILGQFFDPQDIKGEILDQLRKLLGHQGAQDVQGFLESISRPRSGGSMRLILSIVGLLFGATASFAQIQWSLNVIWNVRPDPKHNDLRIFFGKRLLGFGMIVIIAFLLLVSLLLTTGTSAFGDWIHDIIPDGLVTVLYLPISLILDYGMVFILFAAMYKVLPDAKLHWRDVIAGAFVTTLLFVVGKWGISFYLGHSNVGSLFGVAGSLAVLMLWIYLNGILLLLGAEFTWVWAGYHGREIMPEKGAVKVVHHEEYLRGEEAKKYIGPQKKRDHGLRSGDGNERSSTPKP